jgi:hypothetical protein
MSILTPEAGAAALGSGKPLLKLNMPQKAPPSHSVFAAEQPHAEAKRKHKDRNKNNP